LFQSIGEFSVYSWWGCNVNYGVGLDTKIMHAKTDDSFLVSQILIFASFPTTSSLTDANGPNFGSLNTGCWHWSLRPVLVVA
jgi:hypothetical protein